MSGHETIGMVVFDLGGVVVRICRSWREACERAGVAYHESAGTAEAIALRKPIAHEHELGRISSEEYFSRVAGTMGGLYTPVDIQRIHDLWIIEEYRGIGRVIESIQRSGGGVRTGVLSNTNAWHWRQLTSGPHGRAKFPVVERAESGGTVHASHVMGLAKPDGAIYDRYAELVGVDGGEIVFFDDLEDNVRSACERGWDAVRIDHTGDTAEQVRLHLRLRGLDV